MRYLSVVLWTVLVAQGLRAEEAPAPEERSAEGAIVNTDEPTKEVAVQLERKVSFCFIETPLDEALAFLKSLTKLNVICDRDPNQQTAINLKVDDTAIATALERTAGAAGLKVQFVDGALWISKNLIERNPPKVEPLREDQKPQVLEAVQQLADEAYEVRAAAAERLRAIGPAALDLLKAALKPDDDLDRTLQLKRLITEFQWRLTPDPTLAQLSVELRSQLARKVSFEFVDTPLEDAVAFLKSLCQIPMIIQPHERFGHTPVSLRVTDMPLEQCLLWIARLSKGSLQERDGAVFLAAPQANE